MNALAAPWSDVAREVADLCPAASPLDLRASIRAARSAGLAPAAFAAAMWGTQAAARLGMRTGLTLVFEDRDAGALAYASRQGVSLYREGPAGWERVDTLGEGMADA